MKISSKSFAILFVVAQFLLVGGISANQTVSLDSPIGAGTWLKVAKIDLNNEAEAVFLNVDSSKLYRIGFYLKCSHISGAPYLQFNTDSNFNYVWARGNFGHDNGSNYTEGHGNLNDDEILVANAGVYHNGEIEIKQIDTKVMVKSNGFSYQDTNSLGSFVIGGLYHASSDLTQIKFFVSPGNATGEVILYELKE